MKKLTALLLVAALCLSLCTVALADPAMSGTIDGSSITWELSGGTLTIDGTGPMPNFESPGQRPWDDSSSSITAVNIGSGVTAIGTFAFYNCTSLTGVTIPSNVTTIDEWAFYNCTGLTDVTIQSGVTSIGTFSFSECDSLTAVTIPSSVTTIGDWAFTSCENLTTVVIPSGVTSIGTFAFSECSSLTSVTIPSSVTYIGGFAFQECSALTSVTFAQRDTPLEADPGVFQGCRTDLRIVLETSEGSEDWSDHFPDAGEGDPGDDDNDQISPCLKLLHTVAEFNGRVLTAAAAATAAVNVARVTIKTAAVAALTFKTLIESAIVIYILSR